MKPPRRQGPQSRHRRVLRIFKKIFPPGAAIDRTTHEDLIERAASRCREERSEGEYQAAQGGPGVHAARSPGQEGGTACRTAEAMTSRCLGIVLATLFCLLALATSASAECVRGCCGSAQDRAGNKMRRGPQLSAMSPATSAIRRPSARRTKRSRRGRLTSTPVSPTPWTRVGRRGNELHPQARSSRSRGCRGAYWFAQPMRHNGIRLLQPMSRSFAHSGGKRSMSDSLRRQSPIERR